MSSGAMFTAVTGTNAQQKRIDVIAHNLANVGTVGFKRQRAQFEDLLYENVRAPAAEGDSPTGLQFGRGTRIVSTEHVLSPGSMRQTDQPLDIAVAGDGFFAVQKLNNEIAYTRNGQFKLNVNGEIVNAAGLVLQPPTVLPQDAFNITISQDGFVRYQQPGNSSLVEAGRVQLTRFANPGGLSAIGANLFAESPSSGPPILGDPGEQAFGLLKQGSLEEANVNIAEELVHLIIAQRAFEANTRVISAADDMMRFVTQR
jgi:flagellar basal-body rod protein FlgG